MSDLQDRALTVGVRALAETVHRSGGLAGPVYGGVSAAQGNRLHHLFAQHVTQAHPGQAVATEVPLETVVVLGDLQLTVRGRCDALVREQGRLILYEAKSYTGPEQALPPQGDPLHWAQALLYGHLLLLQEDQADLDVVLSYLPDNGHKMRCIKRTATRPQLAAFFLDTCQSYLDRVADVLGKAGHRLLSGRTLPFPYPALRDGQKSFMQAVVGAVRGREALFVCAPTGIGKTMAALYPAVKALANRLTDQVFYLTHMTSARLVAAQALSLMHSQGLLMKGVVLYAKERLCLAPAFFCDPRTCPYGQSYYDHLPQALQSLFPLLLVGREDILEAARRHQVCPFELSLDFAVFCDVVICDYNYAFDPRARLQRFFNQEQTGHLLLVDEAHNLPDRSRGMFSAQLSEKTLQDLLGLLEQHGTSLAEDCRALLALLASVKTALAADQAALDLLGDGVDPSAIMRDQAFRAMRQKPDKLVRQLLAFNAACYLFLDNRPDLPGRHLLLNASFELVFFCRIAQEQFDDTYVTTLRLQKDQQLTVDLLCLDASQPLAETYLQRHAAVFFSATLSPMAYYQRLIAGQNPGDVLADLVLSSPFPPENLLLLVCTSLSTRYRDRSQTVQAVVALVQAATRHKTGNYLVFVPSHAYLKLVRLVLSATPDPIGCDLIFQAPSMTEPQRQAFLQRFERYGEKTLLAFAVMGGIFSEGIDLAGEQCCGVVIVGVGLPQISPEREIMKQYFGQSQANGYPYAYLYPGFNKVQQAAGRLIRSEADRGFVLLIDDRYGTPVYRSLFPHDWQPMAVDSPDQVSEAVQLFWGPEGCVPSQ